MNVYFNDKRIPELRVLLDRAMNTWDQVSRPAWVQELSDAVDAELKVIYLREHPLVVIPKWSTPPAA